MKWYLMLDCWPGYPRPGDIYEDINADLNLAGLARLPKTADETVRRLMGEWEWNFDTTEDYGKAAQAIIWQTIQKHFNPGRLAKAMTGDTECQWGLRYYATGNDWED